MILFFAITALYSFFNGTLRIELQSKNRTAVLKLAQEMMEEQIYMDPAAILDHDFQDIINHPGYQYRVATGSKSFTDAGYPNYVYNVKEVTVTVRGPMEPNGTASAKTQYMSMRVWKPLAPTSVEDKRTGRQHEAWGNIY